MIPIFLDGRGGRIFGIYHPPASGIKDLGDFIFLPPFGEELNRSRHMIARQARRFAALGKGVFILDLFGTGDSDGNFEEANWGLWLDNIRNVTAWLKTRGRPAPDIWAMRTGALLAASAVTEKILSPSIMILWSPVSNGEIFLSQFLRIRLAALLEQSGAAKETTKDLRARLEGGEIIEVGGYGLNGKLADSLSRQRLSDFKPPAHSRLHWLELNGGEDLSLSPAAEKLVNGWKQAGLAAEAKVVTGPAFWTLQETEWAEDLITATSALDLGGGA